MTQFLLNNDDKTKRTNIFPTFDQQQSNRLSKLYLSIYLIHNDQQQLKSHWNYRSGLAMMMSSSQSRSQMRGYTFGAPLVATGPQAAAYVACI